MEEDAGIQRTAKGYRIESKDIVATIAGRQAMILVEKARLHDSAGGTIVTASGSVKLTVSVRIDAMTPEELEDHGKRRR
jgi:hypothetical protein